MQQPTGDARRTSLANERTQLAWWRTGLTAMAVSLAVGKLVPDIGDRSTQWPYTLVGVGFALYGVALIAYGTARSRAVDQADARGEFAPPPAGILTGLAVVGAGLGLFTALLVIVD